MLSDNSPRFVFSGFSLASDSRLRHKAPNHDEAESQAPTDRPSSRIACQVPWEEVTTSVRWVAVSGPCIFCPVRELGSRLVASAMGYDIDG